MQTHHGELPRRTARAESLAAALFSLSACMAGCEPSRSQQPSHRDPSPIHGQVPVELEDATAKSAPTTRSASNESLVRFEAVEIDLGVVAPDSVHVAEAVLINDSERSITIQRIIPSGSGVFDHGISAPVPPGGRQAIRIPTRVPGVRGWAFSRPVTVQLVGEPPLKFTIRGRTEE